MDHAGAPLGTGSPRRLAPPALLVVVVLAAAAVWISFRIYTGIQLEDALITFRYARNLAEGNGFVFNPGERVLGTTTPLLTLLLGALGAIFGSERIPLLSNIIMMPAAAAAGLLTGAALNRFGCPRPLALCVTSAFLLHPDVIWVACGGMETPLVLLLMAAGLYALSRDAFTSASAASALLVLTRIDGIVWAAGIQTVILLRDRKAFLRSLAWGSAVAAPWAIFSLAYFGGLIPHSVVAKRAIGNTYDLLDPTHLAEHAASHAPFLASSAPFFTPAGVLFFLLGALSLRRQPPASPLWLPALFPFAFSLALYLGRAPLYFDWYLTPISYAALIVGALGIGRVVKPLESWGENRLGRRAVRLVLVALGAAYLALLGHQGWVTARFHRDYQINEDATRRWIGEWLSVHTMKDSVVAMEAVGYQAYYSNRRVVDLAGLVSPAVVAIRRESWSNADAFYRVLRDLEPDYLVLRSFEVDSNVHYHGGRLFETAVHTAYFAEHYQEVRRFEAPVTRLWGNTSYLTVYRRIR